MNEDAFPIENRDFPHYYCHWLSQAKIQRQRACGVVAKIFLFFDGTSVQFSRPIIFSIFVSWYIYIYQISRMHSNK